MPEYIRHGDTILAIILRSGFSAEDIQFFTPDTFSQQLGYMRHPAGYAIAPHDHNPVPRAIEWTQEVLLVKSGKIRLDIYAPKDRSYIQSHILEAGDIALLAHGGHGLVMLEPSELVEVKQGPYTGAADKTRFAPVHETQVILK
jgi:hypothetical protein